MGWNFVISLELKVSSFGGKNSFGNKSSDEFKTKNSNYLEELQSNLV